MISLHRATSLATGSYLVQAHESIEFGREAEAALLDAVERQKCRRVFIICSKSLSQMSDGPLARIAAALDTRFAGTFTNVQPHTPRQNVLDAANCARKLDADLIVSLGGGSVIDAAKGILICLWHGIMDISELDALHITAKNPRPIRSPGDPIRLITISTTLSGSEFTPLAGITDAATRTKQIYRHELLVPRTVILDPRLLMRTPAWVLFSTGIRAVDNAIESYCSPKANLATEMHSIQGLKSLTQALPKIKSDPHNLDHYLEAQFGVWHATLAIVTGAGTGASHGIGYALGASQDVPHGHTSCVLLPAVLNWNASQNRPRQEQLCHAAGLPGTDLSNQVSKLVKCLGQPGKLRDLNIDYAALDDIATRAVNYPSLKDNPVPITTIKDVRQILDLAW